MDDNSIPELDKYGIFFMWPDYIPESMYDQICQNAKRLRSINHTVVQDLEDFIIAEGPTATISERKKDIEKSAREDQKLMEIQDLDIKKIS